MPRFYVTLTWDNWPEGGSYGTVVEAKDYDDAELQAKIEMAASRASDHCYQDEPAHCHNCFNTDQDGSVPTTCIDCGSTDWFSGVSAEEKAFNDYANTWHVVDCYDLDEHIKTHMPVFQEIDRIHKELNEYGESPTGDTYNDVLQLLRPWLPKENP